jgi:hypothetical protein
MEPRSSVSKLDTIGDWVVGGIFLFFCAGLIVPTLGITVIGFWKMFFRELATVLQ